VGPWRRDPEIDRGEWIDLARMVMGIDAKIDRIPEEMEIDDGEEEDRS
jgi:hypothetical protein